HHGTSRVGGTGSERGPVRSVGHALPGRSRGPDSRAQHNLSCSRRRVMSETTYDFPEPGLYFDAGCRSAGELDQEIISLAMNSYGWAGPDDVDVGSMSAEYEFISDVADDGISYLNGLESREGLSWGYDDNGAGFGLWADDEGGAP